ncbi:MAG: CvpA family protein [Clostridia bacterium]|nr:CvpA family protein [Clostridia bacterium]
MNIVDIVVVGIIALSILIGLYRGFVSSAVNTGGCVLSLFAAFKLGPKLAELIKSNQGLTNTLLSYTDASSRIGDIELSLMKVANLTGEKITEVLSRVDLPYPLNQLLKVNLENQVFAPSGMEGTVGNYVSQTIVGTILNVICFVVCFIAVFLAVSILLNLIKVIFKLPVLKQLNSVVGGVFGLLRGLLLCYIAFALLPLLQTMLPLDMITELVEQSTLAPMFNTGNLIIAIMNGRL